MMPRTIDKATSAQANHNRDAFVEILAKPFG